MSEGGFDGWEQIGIVPKFLQNVLFVLKVLELLLLLDEEGWRYFESILVLRLQAGGLDDLALVTFADHLAQAEPIEVDSYFAGRLHLRLVHRVQLGGSVMIGFLLWDLDLYIDINILVLLWLLRRSNILAVLLVVVDEHVAVL